MRVMRCLLRTVSDVKMTAFSIMLMGHAVCAISD